MWAEALSEQGVPSVVRCFGTVGPDHLLSPPITQPYGLYVLASQEEQARSLIPEEYQTPPAPKKDVELAVPKGGEGFHLGAKTFIYLVCLALLGVLLWLALSL